MPLNTDRLALEVKRARKPFGLVLALLLVALVCAFLMFKNIEVRWPWSAANEVKVEFADVKGVRPGQQQVRLSGVPVGLITGAKVRGDKAVLTLSIDDKYGKIYKNARMRLRPVTPLEDMYVSIESRGTPSAGQVTGDTVLASKQTESPVDVSSVLNTLDPDTRKRTGTLLDGLTAGLDGDGGRELKEAFVALAPFMEEAQKLLDAIGDRRQNMKQLIHNSGQLLAALNARSKQLGDMIEQGNGTLAELARKDAPLASTLAQLPATLSTMRTSFAALRDAEGELDPALKDLRPVATRLPASLKAVRQLSADAIPALDRLRPAAEQLRPLARTLVPTSDALAKAVDSLRLQAPRLDRATTKITPCSEAIRQFFQNTLSVFKFSDDYGAIPRGELVEPLTAAGGVIVDPSHVRQATCSQKEGK